MSPKQVQDFLRGWETYVGVCETQMRMYEEKWYPGLGKKVEEVVEEESAPKIQEEHKPQHQNTGLRYVVKSKL